MPTLAPVLGWILVIAAMADLFITVLSARADLGLLNTRLHRLLWELLRSVARLFPPARSSLLALAGPIMLIASLISWLTMLLAGFALIVYPALGEEIVHTHAPIQRDFATALYYSGCTLATLGYGEIVPMTTSYRLLAVLESLAGFSILTLSLAYFISIYSSITRRNTLALMLHHASGNTDDAAELLANLGAGGDFTAAPVVIQELNRALSQLYEAHNAYPVIRYFRFRDRYYAFTHLLRISADFASLAATTLDVNTHGAFVRSSVLLQARLASQHILQCLTPLLLPGGAPHPTELTERQREEWSSRQTHAAQRLRESGIAARDDEHAQRNYLQARLAWDPIVAALADYLLEADA